MRAPSSGGTGPSALKKTPALKKMPTPKKMPALKKVQAMIAGGIIAATAAGCSGIDTRTGGDTITLSTVPGFDDTVAVTALWTVLLEDRDFAVETRSMDLAPTFAGIARGDVDGYVNAWLPDTHSVFIDEYREDLVILDDGGPYFDDNRLVFVVPEAAEEDTISDLVENAEDYDSEIIGIEAGAGAMQQLPEVLETYEADDEFEVIDGSTPAALVELERAAESGENVVIVLWTPHWAFADMPVKALEDDLGGWGEPDGSHVVLSEEFAEARPEVAEWMSNSELSDEEYSSLMLAVDEAETPTEGAREWLEAPDHQETADQWFQ